MGSSSEIIDESIGLAEQAATLEDRIFVYEYLEKAILENRELISGLIEKLKLDHYYPESVCQNLETDEIRMLIHHLLMNHFPSLEFQPGEKGLKACIEGADSPEQRRLAEEWYMTIFRENLCYENLRLMEGGLGFEELDLEKLSALFPEEPAKKLDNIEELEDMALKAELIGCHPLAEQIRMKIREVERRKKEFGKGIRYLQLGVVMGGSHRGGSIVVKKRRKKGEKLSAIKNPKGEKIIERSTYAEELLGEMGISPDLCDFKKGAKESEAPDPKKYYKIVVPELDIAIFVCNYGNNKTFILYSADKKFVESYEDLDKNQWEQLIQIGHMSGLIWYEPKEEWQRRLRKRLERRQKIEGDPIPREELPKPEEFDENWATARGAVDRLKKDGLKISKGTVIKFARRSRKAKPEWIKWRYTKEGRPRIHYAPELIELLKRDIEEHPPAPEDWMTTRALCDFIEEAYPSIKNVYGKIRTIADKYKETKCYQKMRQKRGHKLIHYSPELISIIIDEIVLEHLAETTSPKPTDQTPSSDSE